MDFRFTTEEEKFRQEVRQFLKKELPPDWGGMDYISANEEEHAYGLAFDRKLARKGWLTIAWPKEYGGMGASHIEQMIFNEEKGYFRAPTGGMHGVALIGPTLIVHGSEEQKKEHLTRIARADAIWCQGFSEPQSGSDLASLQLKAVEDGDDFVLNGQKIFSTNAHYADWIFLLARTDPTASKHRGISYLIADMKTPGITVRRLWVMSGGGVNETFFDDVRVPKRNLIGPKNMGWYVAMTTLNFERSGVAGVAEARRTLEELVDYSRDTRTNGKTLYSDPRVRHRLAQMAVEIEMGRMLAYHITWMQSKGLIPEKEAPMAKLFTSELSQRLANTGMQILGPRGLLEEGSRWAALRGHIEHAYLHTVSATIVAGTSEIQRMIVATRGLGLPRD